MHKTIIKFIAALFIVMVFLLLINNKTQAQTCIGGEETDIYFCSTNGTGTTWQVRYDYYFADGRPFSAKNIWVSINGTGYKCPSGASTDQYNYFVILNYKPDPLDELYWSTTCTDPEILVTPATDNFCKYGEGMLYTDSIDISCYDIKSKKYAGCWNLNANNLGSVYFTEQCPYSKNTDSICTKEGKAASGLPTCGNAYCGGTNNCTYSDKICSGTSCLSPNTAYSTYCGNGAGTGTLGVGDTTPLANGADPISGTNMCGSYSYYCSPPAPTVTATASCNNGQPRISATWTTPSYSSGAYDLRWRQSGGSFTNVCSPTEPYVISSGLSDNTTYEIQVRGSTTAGHNGPTAFGSDTVTTPNCGSTISGNVYNDNDNSGSKNTGDTNHSGVTVILSNGATDTTDTNGNYSFAGIAAGTYTTSLPASVTGYYMPIRTSSSLTIPPDQTYNFRLVPLSTININVYNDYNGNATYEPALGETLASGQTVTVTGRGAQTYITDGTTKTISNLNPGSSTITVGALASGWTFTTTNSVPVSYPPPVIQPVNIGIKPPAPTCTSLTANPTSVSPGGTSILTCNSPSSPAGGSIVYTYYDDSTIAGDSVTNNNTNTSTFRAPNPYWNQTVAYPSVSVCNPGGAGAACNNYQAAITIIPRFSISGSVFTDNNKDGLKNGSDTNYTDATSTIQIRTGSCGGPLIQSINTANGTYATSPNLVGGTYYVCYTSLPGGYKMTYPVNGPPASFSVRVGNVSTGGACTEGSNSATCDANGNITNLNYGISNSIPWIQTTGGDPYGGSSPIPSTAVAACGGPYFSLQGNGGTPGVVYCGSGICSTLFGSGQPSQNPYNWQVGNETYNKKLKTSYNILYQTALKSGITPTALGISQCGAGGIGSCALSGTLANGVYIANGSLTINSMTQSNTFSANRDIVILVNGNLNINTEIHVPTTSTAIFSVSGNINVGSGVGEATVTSSRANIEGYYSTDQNFYVKSLDANGDGANCPVSDRRLNIAGSVVVNATGTGGSFLNQRDLCAGNLQCPASTVIERPDFVLNAPEFLKSARRIWQEIAP